MEEGESVAPNPQELRAIREILLSLSKVLKASRVYNPDNPAYQKLFLNYANNFLKFLENWDVLIWDIGQFHISYRGEVVYENRNPSESLAFHLYKDGLRQLRFLRELELSEIEDFLDLLKSSLFEADADDDLATLLWERDFVNIRASVVDTSQGGGESAEGSDLSLLSQRLLEHGRAELEAAPRSISESVTVVGPSPPSNLPDSMPSFRASDLPLFSIGEQGVEKIQSEMAEEAGKDVGQEFISLLLEILSAKEDIGGTKEILAIVVRIAESYCLQGNFLKASQIVRDLRQLLELSSGLPDPRRASIRQAVERMGSSESLGRLGKVLDRANEGEFQDFRCYVSLLGTQAIVPLCEMLGDLQQMKSRRMLCEAIAEMARGHVDQLASATKDPRWFVARNMAHILGMMRDPRGVKYLKELADHGELRVKKMAIRGLGAIGNSESRDFLLAYLQSSEGSIQALAAQTLANLKEKRALPVLLKILEEGQFLNRNREEKMEIFDAVGRLGSDLLLPLLKNFLYRKAVFHRGRFEEMIEGAALALAMIGTEAARRILQEGAGGNDRAIERACRAALSQIRSSIRLEGEEMS